MALPGYLTEQTEEAILQRMLDRVPSDVDRSEGSFIWDSLAPAAYQFYMATMWAQEVLRRGFASTAFGEYLDLRCEERGVTRRAAVKAAGEVAFTGTAGTAIPLGTRVATPADDITQTPSIEYETTAAGVLDSGGSATIAIAAVEAGAGGNVPIGAISVLVNAIAGLVNVTNAVATSSGAEAESDESLLTRYLVKVREPGTSGNKADYLQWALEIPGVSGAQVQPLWDGPGTVKVFLLDADKRAPNQTIVDAVQEYISPTSGQGDGKAPIGAAVTVAAADEVAINISVQVTLASDASLAEVQDKFESGVIEYLQQLAFTDPLVRYTRIAAVLLDIPPIIDYASLTVNAAAENIEMQLGQVAVLGTVTMSE